MPATLDELLQQGADHNRGERWDDAEAAFTKALDQAPGHVPALLGRGRARLGRKDWGDASDDFDAAERRGCTCDPVLYRSRATASYFSAFDHEDRLADADRLLALVPDDPDGWFLRGDALSDLGDYEEGIDSLTKAIELKPDHADAHYQRGQSWRSLGDLEKATADYLASTRLGSTDPNTYHTKGHYFQDQGDYRQARLEFARASELEPESSRHYGCAAGIVQALEGEGVITSDEAERFFTDMERLNGGSETPMTADRHHVYNTVQDHFGRVPLEQLELTERSFPPRAMPDIQCAFDGLKDNGFEIAEFWATSVNTQAVQQFASLYNLDRRSPVKVSNPRYAEYNIGEDEPFRALKDGVWLLKSGGSHLLALLDTTSNCYVVRIELAAQRTPEGTAATERFFQAVEEAIRRSRCYRGKMLSMAVQDNYSGTAPGLMVHRVGPVARGEVILPKATLDLIDRNVIRFVGRRDKLRSLGMSTKKGLLLYGPPGVGKTHTVHYLATNLPGHTTLLITGEQIGNLAEYMTLARLYVPSLVVIEDVDLIARHRDEMRGGPEEVMLNKLLNEMDGTNPNADILFVLTTNHASALEAALASRPGRIDQAIEFPLPTAEGRAKLVQLYSGGVTVSEPVAAVIVDNTEDVSASFIKELMRRCLQFALERDDFADRIEIPDVRAALEELLVTGGALNKTLLGALRNYESRKIGFAPA